MCLCGAGSWRFLFSHTANWWRYWNNWTWVCNIFWLQNVYFNLFYKKPPPLYKNPLLFIKKIFFVFFKCNAENYMTGYRMVFDRENLKLAWSRSNCEFPSLLIYIKDLFWYSQLHRGLLVDALMQCLKQVIPLGSGMPTAICLPCHKYLFAW